ncbi:MAG TPA: DUF1295 domain-containing protein [Bacteroidales bacterium]|nr:DUF1295 domain-containing protein [Bacteroidales bacterium]
MTFLTAYFSALPFLLGMMTLLWIVSIFIRNVSIVDLFWGAGFVVAAAVYFFLAGGTGARTVLVPVLTAVWGLRLSLYLTWRNRGKGEDFRYRKFRSDYGEHRYWWVSFFQVFLLQGILMWLVSAPLLGAQYGSPSPPLSAVDGVAIVLWVTGMIFETGGDLQLARFRSDPGIHGAYQRLSSLVPQEKKITKHSAIWSTT